jgi:hypothetical protein
LALKGTGSTLWIQRVNRDVLDQCVGHISLWDYLVQKYGVLPLEDEIQNVSCNPQDVEPVLMVKAWWSNLLASRFQTGFHDFTGIGKKICYTM